MPRIAVAAACLGLLALAAPAQAAAEDVPGELLVRFERGVGGAERADARDDGDVTLKSRPACRGSSSSRPSPARRWARPTASSRATRAWPTPSPTRRAAGLDPQRPLLQLALGPGEDQGTRGLGRDHGQLGRDGRGGRHRRGLRPPRPGQPDVDQLRRDARTTAWTTTATATWTTSAAGTPSTTTTTRATSRSTGRMWPARSGRRATTPQGSPAWPRTRASCPCEC